MNLLVITTNSRRMILKSTKYQVAGDHYKKLKIQPIEYVLANNIPFAEGCIIKYATRWRDKGGIDDLRKIIQFCEFLIEHELSIDPSDTGHNES